MVETRSGKMQDPAQERIKAEESAKPQLGATIGGDASSDPVVLNPNIDIPKYDGTEDPRPWIESLEEIGFLYHWADYIIARYAAMNMTGSAKTWLNLHKASFTSWENIKILLIQDFSLDANKEELRMKHNRMQHWNEPAIRFAEDILVLCNKVDPAMEEETKIDHVIGGLKKEYSFALYLNPPKTTDELLVVCKKMDSFEKKYRERVEKSRNLYNGPRYSRPQQQSRYVPPTATRNYQTPSRPQAPVSNNYKNDFPPTLRQYRNNLTQPFTPRRHYNPNFVPKPNLQRNTYNKSQEVSKNRTEDGRPICFKCNKPGHVARYCRVKFIRILEEDPTATQEKIEEKCQMNEISDKSGPRLYADIGTFEALVDTGADLSVVDLRTALDTGHGISKLAKTCAGPDGKKLDIVGNILLNIKIDDKALSHKFVILKTHLRTLIFGRDFLKKMNAKIDCKKEIIKYDLTNNHDISNYELKKIKSVEDTVIPELSIRLIKASIEAEDGEYVIEENNRMIQTNGLRLARSLLTVTDRKTHNWIMNPYPRPLKIMKDQTLAHGSLPAEVKFIEKLEQINNDEIQFQINKNLSPKEQEDLKQILSKYADLFSPRLGRTNLAKHRIDTEDAKPIKHKPYRVSPKERDIIKDQIDEMLKEGIIRPSSSPWSFPVILVKKRDGKFRFCVDYRKLNEVTVKDVYPIPRIDDVMDTLQGSKYFSAIDLRSGYWQVEIEEKDKEKTAFTTTHGLYEFNVMPFGLCNAPATFERNMDNVLGNLRWQICLCYLDDVIIYSSDFPTHLKRLEAVLKCFSESNLKLNDRKCRFAFEELEILGHITNQQGIKPAEYNIKAVRDFPQPKKVKEVQSFLGMCSYYRKFIKDFSLIADPLTGLIRKNAQFTWTEKQEEAFQNLKKALINPPILGHFDPNAATYIHTDASNIGLGATLVQIICGEEKVISYLSRTLSKAEQNYSTTEKECLAVVWAISKLRPYLYGRHFKIITDHHALCWLKNLKDPTGRLARWALKIQEYDFDIIHKSGKKHMDADGLSRGPLPETDWVEDYERLFLNQIINEEDEFIENVKKSLKGSKRAITQNFKEENGCLYKKNPNPEGRAWLLVVPKKRRKEIMSEFHNHMLNGHLGVARTTYRLKNKYHWPSMLKDVSEFVKTCHLCQSRKGSNQSPSGLLQPIPPANYPFERIGIDFVGPLPSTKRRRKCIIVLTDYYTRYAETKAVSEATVKEVSTFLIEQIFLRHGAPRFLVSDRGSQFTSNLMKEVMKMCKVKHCFTTSYHPQTNGLTERLNRTLINMISMYVNTDQKNWDEILPFVTHSYNTTIQETTGYSPFFLLFGREPMSLLDDDNIPIDNNMNDYDEYIENYLDKIARTRQVVINNTEKTQERMKRNYDKKHNERIYEPGHLVAVWTPVRKIGKCEKLLRKYFGPYRILKKLSNVNYLIEPKDNPGQDPLIVHVSRLKPYFERIDEVTHEDRSSSMDSAPACGKRLTSTKASPGRLWSPKLQWLEQREEDYREAQRSSADRNGQRLGDMGSKLAELEKKMEALEIENTALRRQRGSNNSTNNGGGRWPSHPAGRRDYGDNTVDNRRAAPFRNWQRRPVQQPSRQQRDPPPPRQERRDPNGEREKNPGVDNKQQGAGSEVLEIGAVVNGKPIREVRTTFEYCHMGEIGFNGILGLPGFRALKLHLSYDGSIRSDYERKEDPTKSAFLSSLQTIEMSPQPPRIPLNEIRTGDDIFRAFSHCFCNDINDMGNGSTITAPKLRMLTSKPVYRRQYPIPNRLVSKVKALVDELEEVGIIEGSTSLWNSPLFPVAKTDGSVRITMDLRLINEATEFFPFPIPRVEDNLRAFAGAKVFSTLDLTSGFFLIHIPESDRDYFTFSLPWGRHRFTRLPQGAKNSAQVFQWAMNLVLGDLLFKCVRLYIDDVIVYSDSHEQHVADLAAVLERLSKFGLKAKYGKSYLFRDSVEYLGHVIDQNGIKPMWDNVAALRDLKRPHNIKAVRSLLGTVNYYRRFIPNAGEVLAPLSNLLRKGHRFAWGVAEQSAFGTVKGVLTSEPLLIHPTIGIPFILNTDASGIAVGACLQQEVNGTVRPIAYYSKRLTGPEIRYSTIEKEAYAVVLSLQHFKHLLVGSRVEDQCANTVVRALLERIITTFGVPKTILSDRGSAFMSCVFKGVCKAMGVGAVNTTAWRPQSNGAVERLNRTVIESLRRCTAGNNWDTTLPMVALAIRTTVHASTEFTSAKLVYGHELRLPQPFQEEELNPVCKDSITEMAVFYKRELVEEVERTREMVRQTYLKEQQEARAEFEARELRTFETGDLVLTPRVKIRRRFQTVRRTFLKIDYGLGVILSHRNDRKEECPIAFASRTLTEAEKRFSQLEKKVLSITFGVEKFRQYLLGRKFVLVTDNRPLIHIFSPHYPIPICASSRIKRWSLKLAAFNYTVEFRKTNDNSNVDALSRLPLESSVRESLDEDQVLLLRKSNEVPLSFMEVANETPQDKILSIVLRNVREGNWKFTRVPRENPLAPHYKINEELSLEFGCLQWRERV
ncbi:hypothetical protein LAZ67_11001042, partial [Cordylochernes scorpioides]